MASSYESTQVGDPWMPSLCSIATVSTPFRSPSEPSAFTRYFGATNRDSPFAPSGASGVRASTRCTMFSATSWSPHVMKIFWPLIDHEPSPRGVAIVRIAPRSVPAPGSVRFIVPVHSPLTSLVRYVSRSSSDAAASRAWICPALSSQHSAKAAFEAFQISPSPARIDPGSPSPPADTGASAVTQPASTNAAYASANPAGRCTWPSSRRAPSRSPTCSRGASTEAANSPAPAMMSTPSSAVSSPPVARATMSVPNASP